MKTEKYNQEIDKMILSIQQIYSDCEWLRDNATLDEKKYWNEMRRVFYDAEKPLRELKSHLYNMHMIPKPTLLTKKSENYKSKI